MSDKRDLNKPHRCLARRCRGVKVDPPEFYGVWAYWWGENSNGWHAREQQSEQEPR